MHVISSSSSLVCKTWWEAREACIYIGSTCYDVISSSSTCVYNHTRSLMGFNSKPFLLTLEKLISA